MMKIRTMNVVTVILAIALLATTVFAQDAQTDPKMDQLIADINLELGRIRTWRALDKERLGVAKTKFAELIVLIDAVQAKRDNYFSQLQEITANILLLQDSIAQLDASIDLLKKDYLLNVEKLAAAEIHATELQVLLDDKLKELEALTQHLQVAEAEIKRLNALLAQQPEEPVDPGLTIIFPFPKAATVPVMKELNVENGWVVKFELGLPNDQVNLITDPQTNTEWVMVDHDRPPAGVGSCDWRIAQPQVPLTLNPISFEEAAKQYSSKPAVVKERVPKARVLAYNIPAIHVAVPTPGSDAEYYYRYSYPVVAEYDALCPTGYLWREDETSDKSYHAVRLALEMARLDQPVLVAVNYRWMETAAPENQNKTIDRAKLLVHMKLLAEIEVNGRGIDGFWIWHNGYEDDPTGGSEQIQLLKDLRTIFPVDQRIADEVDKEVEEPILPMPSGSFSASGDYQQGSGKDLTFNVTNTIQDLRVIFQTWSDVSESIEAVYVDDEAPFVYPSASLNTVTPGNASIQALLRNKLDGTRYGTVELPTVFKAKPVVVSGDPWASKLRKVAVTDAPKIVKKVVVTSFKDIEKNLTSGTEIIVQLPANETVVNPIDFVSFPANVTDVIIREPTNFTVSYTGGQTWSALFSLGSGNQRVLIEGFNAVGAWNDARAFSLKGCSDIHIRDNKFDKFDGIYGGCHESIIENNQFTTLKSYAIWNDVPMTQSVFRNNVFKGAGNESLVRAYNWDNIDFIGNTVDLRNAGQSWVSKKATLRLESVQRTTVANNQLLSGYMWIGWVHPDVGTNYTSHDVWIGYNKLEDHAARSPISFQSVGSTGIVIDNLNLIADWPQKTWGPVAIYPEWTANNLRILNSTWNGVPQKNFN